MRISDRIALGLSSDALASLADVEREVIIAAKSDGAQVCAAGGDVVQEAGIYWFTLSTENVNRRGDIIRQRGLDFSNWSKTPVVLHNHDDDLPIGMGTIRREGAETHMGVQFSAVNPRALMLRAMLDEGMPMAASIAILPTKVHDPVEAERKTLGLGRFGVVYERADVFEGSVVTIPVDPDAVRNCLRSAHVGDDREVERFVETMAATEMDLARRLRADKRAPTLEHAGLDAAIARLEASLDRAAARIEHAARGGVRRESKDSNADTPNAARGIDTASFLHDLAKEVRIARGAKES